MHKGFGGLLAALVVWSGGIAGASAQSPTVTCESEDYRPATCPIDTRGRVRLVRQISDTACREGVNWGITRHAVWVRNSCSGVFVAEGGPGWGGGPPARQ
ncbi:MAG: DUF3011 domain-containing protein, partial [Rubrivivax sp.]